MYFMASCSATAIIVITNNSRTPIYQRTHLYQKWPKNSLNGRIKLAKSANVVYPIKYGTNIAHIVVVKTIKILLIMIFFVFIVNEGCV